MSVPRRWLEGLEDTLRCVLWLGVNLFTPSLFTKLLLKKTPLDTKLPFLALEACIFNMRIC